MQATQQEAVRLGSEPRLSGSKLILSSTRLYGKCYSMEHWVIPKFSTPPTPKGMRAPKI